MLTDVKVGDNVVGYPFGNGKVVEIDRDRGKYCISVTFVNCRYTVTFSQSGHNVEWQIAPSCWTIKNAPKWIWDYFEKPKIKVKKPIDAWIVVFGPGDMMIYKTLDMANSVANRSDPKLPIVKFTGEYEVEEYAVS